MPSMKVIPGIKIVKDGLNYKDHGLNCFVVPKYLATQAFREENPDIFYLYYYLFSHYNLFNLSENPASNFEQPFDGDRVEQLVLNTKLGLELVREDLSNQDAIEKIESCIDQGWPVLIPTNKRAYYYCWKHFREMDGAHLLLVTGYYKEKELFAIHDGEQQSIINSVYAPFYMTYSMLMETFHSYNEHFQYMKNAIQYMRPFEQGTIIKNGAEAIIDISRTLAPYVGRERELIQPKINFVAYSPILKRHLIVYINGQPILTKMLLQFSYSFDSTDQFRKELEHVGEELYWYWKQLTTLIGVVLGQGIRRDADVDRLVDKIIKYEEKFIRLMVELGQHQPLSY